MSEAPSHEQQRNEMVNAGAGAGEGAISGLLHKEDRMKQAKDSAQQLVAQAKAAEATQSNKNFKNDIVHDVAGLDNFVGSRHAQVGSHGLSGQGPK